MQRQRLNRSAPVRDEAVELGKTSGTSAEETALDLDHVQEPFSPQNVLRLQRAVGNQAVGQILAQRTIARAADVEATDEVAKQNERIRQYNLANSGKVEVGTDGRLRQKSLMPLRRENKQLSPEQTSIAAEPKTEPLGRETLTVTEDGAKGLEGRSLFAQFKIKFFSLFRRYEAKLAQREIRGKIANILITRGLMVAEREGEVAATSEAPPVAAIVQAVTAIQDIGTFIDVVKQIEAILE